MSRLPLDLYAEVTTSDGARFKWDANQPAGSRLRNFSFRTKIGEGFSDAAGQLARRIDLDYRDLGLAYDVVFTGADGTVAYEGRIEATPRDLGDTHSIGVTLAGWMAHAKDKKFAQIYVDRDLGAWGAMSARRRAVALAASRNPVGDGQARNDPTNNDALVATAINGPWSSPYKPTIEAWYDAGPGLAIGYVGYAWAIGTGINSADASWNWAVNAASDDAATATIASGNLRAAGPVTDQTLDATAQSYRFAFLQLQYETTPAGADGAEYSINWKRLAVYGNSGVPRPGGETGQPGGVYASDVIRDIASRYCPQLDTSGVQDTDYVIQHLAFKGRTYPFDAFLEVNKFHLWHLGVWEGKRLDFRPYDMTDYQWEIRTDDPGTTFSPQGPSTEDLFNGIAVTFTDLLTGVVNVLTPDDDATLADTSTENPWNKAGIDHWDEITLSTPTLAASALQLGRAALADRNRARTPGTITVRGYIRDRAGTERPVWKVRAGDTIAITNFNDAIRLIVETDYNDEDKSIRLAIDKPFALLEAVIDRQSNALQARGLS